MKEKYNFWIFLEGASSTLNNVLSMQNNVLSTLNNVLSTVCPWFVHGLIFWNIKVTNSYSAQVFPSIFNCGDLYCNCGHLSSRPGQDAKKRPLWVKKHPFYKGCLRNVRGSLGNIYIIVRRFSQMSLDLKSGVLALSHEPTSRASRKCNSLLLLVLVLRVVLALRRMIWDLAYFFQFFSSSIFSTWLKRSL